MSTCKSNWRYLIPKEKCTLNVVFNRLLVILAIYLNKAVDKASVGLYMCLGRVHLIPLRISVSESILFYTQMYHLIN